MKMAEWQHFHITIIRFQSHAKCNINGLARK